MSKRRLEKLAELTPGESRKKLYGWLDVVFSKLVRLSAANGLGNVECFTCCYESHWKGMDAGHWRSRGRAATRWDSDNCRPQCKACNKWGRVGQTPSEKLTAVLPDAMFVGPGEPKIFEQRLRLEGIDVDEVTTKSRKPAPSLARLELLLEEYEEIYASIVDVRS
jgi:hypothetical protein